MIRPKVTMRQALEDENLLGHMLKGESWQLWRVVLIASRGERLTSDEKRLLRRFTKRNAPKKPVDELWLVVGRRGGKSRSQAVLALYYTTLCTHDYLAPGETAVALVIAVDKVQSRKVLKYAEAGLKGSKQLKQYLKKDGVSGDTLELTNSTSIEVHASSFRRVRGSTFCVVLADEVAFWMSEDSANPDKEILDAVRPGLATSHGVLACASSPYARKGELYTAWAKHFGDKPGADPDILVLQGASREFNPALSEKFVQRQYERDEAAASAEYGAKFRSDVESFLSKEAVDQCVSLGVLEISPHGRRYFGFVDPSGGSKDSFTLCIGHREADVVIIDALRDTRPPFAPSQVVKEYCELLKSYGIHSVIGDAYAGEWPREQFAKRGVTYQTSPIPKSGLYLSLLAAINSRTIELLDNKKLTAQLVNLERRTSRGGRDSIDHAPGGFDDLANACAGVVHNLLAKNQDLHTAFFPPVIITGARASG